MVSPTHIGSDDPSTTTASGMAAVTLDIASAIQTALEFHQSGRLPQADAIYQQILQAEPNHPDALHLSGLIALQSRKSEAAVELIGRAIRENPSSAFYYNNLGLAFQNLGKFNEMVLNFRKAVELEPAFPEAHYNLGNALRELGNLDAAADSYRQAISFMPEYVEAHSNLGLVFQSQGKLDAAAECFRKAISLEPEYAELHYNLGNALQDQGKLDSAAECYRQAISLEPDYAEPHNNLGKTLQRQGMTDAAIACYRQAIAFRPDFAEAHYNLGSALKEHGKTEEALASYRQVIELEPNNEGVKYLIATLTGGTYERVPDQHIEQVFDNYADRFDQHLVNDLDYKTPQELVSLVKQIRGTPTAAEWDVLDLGCGTGLVGAEISPYAKKLVGVDLSEKMLAKARERNIYHSLIRSELLTMMRNESTSSYDVITAADVFIYLGKLDEIISEAKRLLRKGGLFAFSAEAIEELPSEEKGQESSDDYKLNPTGRYAHSVSYLNRLATTNGYKSLKIISSQARLEKGQPVKAWLVIWEN